MTSVSRQTAIKVIYWNVVVAILIVSLAAVLMVQRVHQYDIIIVREGRNHEVDPRLIASVIWQESHFKPGKIGKAGEIGLMQVTENAAKEWAAAADRKDFHKHDLFNPEVNIQAGTWYLARAIGHWSNRPDPLPYALAEYNAGRTNARRWAKGNTGAHDFWEDITFPLTKRYVYQVLKRYRGGV